MYESYYGLREPAFSLTPDPRFLWLSETHQEALAMLYYGIVRRTGFVLLTGEVGTGKTSLLRAVLDRVPDHVETALVLNTADLSAGDLLRLLAFEFGLEPESRSKVDLLIVLNRFLIDRMRENTSAVVIVDEAQNLRPEVLEELRLLSNLETRSEKLLNIVLTGQPELRRKLASHALRPLRQRIGLDHHLQHLTAEEIEPYLSHRIRVAGGEYAEIFSPDAADVFHSFSGGCPRLISLLADRALLSAFAKQIRPVPAALVKQKAAELFEGGLRRPGEEER